MRGPGEDKGQRGQTGGKGGRLGAKETGKDPTKLGILRKIVRMPKRYLLVSKIDTHQ